MIALELEQRGIALSVRRMIVRAAQTVLDQAGRPTAEMTIVLTDDTRLQEMNRTYRGIDAATDVLSFGADESDPETGSDYLGDVLISVERAEAQAELYRHPAEHELLLLTIHGSLHLLGHDHGGKEEKALMWAATHTALQALGLPADILHE